MRYRRWFVLPMILGILASCGSADVQSEAAAVIPTDTFDAQPAPTPLPPTLLPPTRVPTVAAQPGNDATVKPPAPASKPDKNMFATLDDTQKACLQAAWGAQAFADITGFVRAPSPDEQAAIPSCNIMLPAPNGAPNPQAGAPSPGGHQPNQDQTFVSRSTDGVTWSAGELLAESASVPEVIYTTKGEYWAYWVDFSEATGPNTEQIGVAYSQDGRTWQKRGFATFDGAEGMTPVDPDAFELADGRLRMYFYDIADQTSNKIYSAVSSDGMQFVLEPGIRFEAEQIYDPNVVLLPDGRYRMYLNHTDIWSATSSDGLTFVQDEGVRVEKGAVPGAIVLPDGRVRLYVCQAGIAVYESPDGLAFSELRRGVIDAQGMLCDPSVSATPDGYIMVYKFAEMSNMNNPPQPPAPAKP